MAPLLANGELVGPITLVQNGAKTIGATDAELLRHLVGQQLSVATMLDGSQPVAVGNWGLSRQAGLGLVELIGPIAAGADIVPLDLGAVCATVDTRGMPAVLVGIARDGAGFTRSWIPVQIDSERPAGPDAPTRLASPIDDAHVGANAGGAGLFAWFPANAALGRASEVLVLGVAQAYRGFAKPRPHPVIAEVVGLDDLGRALLASQKLEEREPELRQVAGEIQLSDPPAK